MSNPETLPNSELFLSAAPVQCQLCNGEVYLFAPMSDRASGEIINLVRSFPVKNALSTMESLRGMISDEDRLALLDNARKQGEMDAADFHRGKYDGKAFLGADGVLSFAFVVVRQSHPGLLFSKFKADVHGSSLAELKSNISAIEETIRMLNQSSKEQEVKEETQSPLAK